MSKQCFYARENKIQIFETTCKVFYGHQRGHKNLAVLINAVGSNLMTACYTSEQLFFNKHPAGVQIK